MVWIRYQGVILIVVAGRVEYFHFFLALIVRVGDTEDFQGLLIFLRWMYGVINFGKIAPLGISSKFTHKLSKREKVGF